MQIVPTLVLGYLRTKFKFLSALSKKKAAISAFDLFCTPPTRNSTKLTSIFLQGEATSFSFDKFMIHGYRWNINAGKKVLIIHGFESSIVNFHQYIQPLIDEGYEVLAFDAPAHGLSTGNRINALVYKNFICEVVKRFGPIDAFVTHSLGGLATTMALAEIPHDTTTRLVLIAPATESTTAVNQFFNVIALEDPLVRKEFDQLILDNTGKPLKWYSVTRALAEIKARVLWLHDETDRVTPLSDATAIREQNQPNVHFVITKGLGHSRIYRDPEIIARIQTFLSGV